METCSNLLSSVVCGRCRTPILRDISENRIKKYSCKCGLKIRVLLRCVHCQKSFLNFPYLIRKSNYCSRECYWDSTRLKERRFCKVCNKEFVAPAHLIRKGFGIYCNRKCQHKVYPKRIEKKCLQCKKKLSVQPARARLTKFCSKKCKDDFERDYVEKICKNCNKRFELPRWELNRGKGVFCSRDCFIQYNGESSIETKMRVALKEAGIDFRQEVKIGIYRADFLLIKSNVVLECDGEYWHSIPGAENRDKRKDFYLINKGYKIIRFSEQTIRNSSEAELTKLIFRT